MIKKYNIALTPESKNDSVIQLAQHVSIISDQYRLGANSLPHVTLCHFQLEENEIDTIWQHVCDALSEHVIELEFKNFSCITFDGSIFWISLIPDKQATLYKMHEIVANIVNTPLNRSYALYAPHMTLINTKDNQCNAKIDNLAKSYFPISDAFILSLGKCDAAGQFTQLLLRSSRLTKN